MTGDAPSAAHTARATRLRRAAWAVALAVFVWITLAALWPHEGPHRPQVGYADKVQHFSIWILLALVSWPVVRFARRRRAVRGRLYRTAVVWSGLVVYGALVEVLQLFVPGRSAEVLDGVADALGAAVGCGLMLGWEWWHERRAGGRQGGAEGHDAALQGLDPGSRPADAAEQPRRGGG